jgi:hypothetical protein
MHWGINYSKIIVAKFQEMTLLQALEDCIGMNCEKWHVRV